MSVSVLGQLKVEFVCVTVIRRTLGELVSYKISLTHCTSSQGWVPSCATVCVFVLFRCGVLGLGYTCTYVSDLVRKKAVTLNYASLCTLSMSS